MNDLASDGNSNPAPERAVRRGVPRVSVIMTVGSDIRFLQAAVESILVQDFSDFELVIVDDETERRNATVAALVHRDPRIRIVVNRKNLGTAAAANRGIEAARADIIARLDADDIAEPTRLRRLVAALDADPALGLVGSWFATITENGDQREIIRLPEADLEIRWSFLFSNPFCHSAIVFRRSCFEAAGRYRPQLRTLEDYDLWSRMLATCRTRNIPEVLARYRLNQSGLTSSYGKDWSARLDALREPRWTELGVRYDRQTAQALAIFVAGYDLPPTVDRHAAYRTLLTLLHKFLAAARPLSNAQDEVICRRLARQIVKRIARDRSIPYRGLIDLYRLCRRQRPALTIAFAWAIVRRSFWTP
jgi:glycosyltransferase involved in cell wall biosynthesis